MESIKNISAKSCRAANRLVCLLISVISVMLIEKAQAQTFSEWFKQSGTQKKYLLQQIAALQVYSMYLKKGYAIAQGNLGSISGYLLNEQGEHITHYAGLKKVSPIVAGDSQVKEILEWQSDILWLFRGMGQLQGIDAEEKAFLDQVRSAVQDDCEQVVNTLRNIVSDGQVEMNDAERLKLIQRLHEEMEDNYRFSTGFMAQVKSYATQRQSEKNNVRTLKQVYGID